MESLLPLFPLDVVLFPNVILPLHIFEERYKEMIGECLSSKSPFGILYAHDETVEKIGCTAQILKVLKRYPDGRMDIVALGKNRFEVLLFDNEKSYLRGIVESYDDLGSAELAPNSEVEQLIAQYRDAHRLLDRSEPDELEFKAPYEGLAFRVASALELNNQLRQLLLASRSEKERIGLLSRYFSESIPKLEQMRKAAKRVRSNGNLAPH